MFYFKIIFSLQLDPIDYEIYRDDPFLSEFFQQRYDIYNNYILRDDLKYGDDYVLVNKHVWLAIMDEFQGGIFMIK